MSEESDRVKIYYVRNDETNLGVCVCLLDNAVEGMPKDDVVTLCFGECDKEGRPKNQFMMTPDESAALGEALIGARFLYIEREQGKEGSK